jgi:hypothetical protein
MQKAVFGSTSNQRNEIRSWFHIYDFGAFPKMHSFKRKKKLKKKRASLLLPDREVQNGYKILDNTLHFQAKIQLQCNKKCLIKFLFCLTVSWGYNIMEFFITFISIEG